MKTNLRHLRPPTVWTGITIWDALHQPGYRIWQPGDRLQDHLPPERSTSIAIHAPSPVHVADDTTWSLAPACGSWVVVPDKALTDGDASVLSRHSLLAFNAAVELGRLAEMTGEWPSAFHCLGTMDRLLTNQAWPPGQREPEQDNSVAGLFARHGVPLSGGNPTPRFHSLVRHLLTELVASDLLLTYQLENKLVPVTHRMRTRGIGVDRAALEAVLADYGNRAETTAAQLSHITGRTLNPDDNEAVLASLQALGLPVTATSKVNLCQVDHPAVDALQQYREFRGIGNAARAYLDAIGADGRIHPAWDPLGASTGRYSCSAPAFQALPKNPDLRRCFQPRSGFVYIACDYAQADLRPLASASKDTVMLDIFNNDDLDFHRETAARLMSKPVSAVTEEERNMSKAIVFGVVYGMAAETLVQKARLDFGLVWTAEDARSWMDRFFAIYTGLRDWRETILKEADAATECRSLAHRRRQLLPPGSQHSGYRSRCLMNMPAQGTVADALKEAMVAITTKLSPEDAIIANIHDELLLEVKESRAQETMALVQAGMETALGQMLPGVPVKAAPRIARSLAD